MIFRAGCNGDGAAADFHHPTHHPPYTEKMPMYDTSFFMIFQGGRNANTQIDKD